MKCPFAFRFLAVWLTALLLTSCSAGDPLAVAPAFTQKGAVLSLGISFEEMTSLSKQYDQLEGALDIAFCEDELCKIAPNPLERDWVLAGSEADWTEDELRAALGEPFRAEENARFGAGYGVETYLFDRQGGKVDQPSEADSVLFLKGRGTSQAGLELQKLYQEERSRFRFTSTDGDAIHLGMTGTEVAEALGETPTVEYHNFYLTTQRFPDHQLILYTTGDLIQAVRVGENWRGDFEPEGEGRGFRAYDKKGDPVPEDAYEQTFPNVHFLAVEPGDAEGHSYTYRLLGIRFEGGD